MFKYYTLNIKQKWGKKRPNINHLKSFAMTLFVSSSDRYRIFIRFITETEFPRERKNERDRERKRVSW